MKILPNRSFKTRDEFIQYFTRGSANLIDKNDLIVSLCKDKKVLDLGCIDHSFQIAINLGDNWLHKRIKVVARQVIGIDNLEEDVLQLNKKGYNIINTNVENFDLGQKFEVIIAGDIIEHLSNIGMFLNSVKKHMDTNSILVITTPNPFNLEQTLSAILNNHINVNDQHTVWLSPHNFWELCERHQLSILDLFWIDTRFHFVVNWKGIKLIIINKLINIIMSKRNILKRDFAVIMKIQEDTK